MACCVLEGADGTGKSTLASAIAAGARSRGLTCTVLHFGPPVFDSSSELTFSRQEAEQMLDGVEQAQDADVLVIDRFHWGSAAYGPVFRPDKTVGRYGSLASGDFWRVQRWLDTRGAVTVYCCAPEDVALARMGLRGEDFLSQDRDERLRQHRAVVENYAELYRHLAGTGIKIVTASLLEPTDTEAMADRLLDSDTVLA